MRQAENALAPDFLSTRPITQPTSLCSRPTIHAPPPAMWARTSARISGLAFPSSRSVFAHESGITPSPISFCAPA
ncbi:hypothetical protein [Conexibacter sp. S30A1]|uniref:hypothetical protein n=1 Tax=Conexibacter sp. S30A1 TaxID=2937800 RepID=UPI00200EC209|nr:hypothetical protein [Conexibacter sp. S30A1]